MIKLSISIMHCSWNAERVNMLCRLMERLADTSHLTGLTVSDDIEKRGIWFNCKQAWQQAHPDSTHHLVLQDDMLPCHNFVPALHRIIALKPDEILHLFACNPIAVPTLKSGKHWYTTPEGSWGGAVILPRQHFQWWEWVDRHCLDFHPHCDDTRLDHYALCQERLIWNVIPSLIEHIGYDKSLVGHCPAAWRTSKKYIGEVDPLSLDWSQGADNPEKGELTWYSSYDDLHQHLKSEYRSHFLQKLNYAHKLTLPL